MAKNPARNYAVEYLLRKAGVSDAGIAAIASGIVTEVTGTLAETSGDVSGTLPGPLQVVGLLGSKIDGPPADGDVITYDLASDTWLLGAPTGGSGSAGLPWFNPRDSTYGAVFDGSTDDLAAWNAAIADLNAAGGGALICEASDLGTYVSAGLDPITVPCTFFGFGKSSHLFTDAGADDLITLSADHVWVDRLNLGDTASSRTAGAAIAPTTGFGNHNRYTGLWVEGFYDGVALLYGAEWAMSLCHVTNPVRYGAHVANVDLPDGGDASISDCWFGTRSRNATAAIYQESAGGLKLTNVKVNCNSLADAVTYGGVKRYVVGHHVRISGAPNDTGVSTNAGLSIENVSGDAVLIETVGTGVFGLITYTALEVGLYANNTGRAVKIVAAATGGAGVAGGIGVVSIDSGVFRTDGTARAAVELVNTDRVTLGDFSYLGFNARYTGSGDTNTIDAGSGTTFGTPALTLGTAAAAGSAASAVRTDATIVAFDATAPTTSAIGDSAAAGVAAVAARRDHSHGREALSTATPLVESGAGAVGTGTKSSREDHVHPAASASSITEAQVYGVGGHWEVLMDPATSSPPVPLTTTDGTDWVYGWVSDGG